MRIYALTVVKDEQDIVEQTLRHALGWCERIGIVDNGSTDGTWQTINALASEFPGRVVPVGVFDGLFSEDLRLLPFRHLLTVAEPPDWWCRLDADEIYPEDPRAFLSALPRTDCRVNAINLFYEFTDLDMAAWDRGDETIADRQRPIQQRRRYYRASYQELRFMRHHPRLSWRAGDAWPGPRGPLSPRHILMQHFRSRDPLQLQARLAIRDEAAEQGQRKSNHHWRVSPSQWRSLVVPHQECVYDAHDGRYVVDYARFRMKRSKRAGQLLRRMLTAIGLRV